MANKFLGALLRSREEYKRRRLNPTHRWTHNETRVLLAAILEEVKNEACIHFEKPTARIFYEKISRTIKGLPQTKNHNLYRDKMRNMKKTYIRACHWMTEIGSAELAAGNQMVVSDYFNRNCPFWNQLDLIYGQGAKRISNNNLQAPQFLNCAPPAIKKNEDDEISNVKEENFTDSDLNSLCNVESTFQAGENSAEVNKETQTIGLLETPASNNGELLACNPNMQFLYNCMDSTMSGVSSDEASCAQYQIDRIPDATSSSSLQTSVCSLKLRDGEITPSILPENIRNSRGPPPQYNNMFPKYTNFFHLLFEKMDKLTSQQVDDVEIDILLLVNNKLKENR